MSKVFNKIVNFITYAMAKWRVELTMGERTQTDVKIQRDTFQRYLLTSLLFVLAINSLRYVLRKYTGGYKFKIHKKRLIMLCAWIT